MGIAYERCGHSQKAIDALSKAVNLNPSNVDARLNLASMYANQGHTGSAIQQFKQIIQIDGSNPTALTNLSKLLVAEKKLDEAKHYLREAIAHDPNNAEAHWQLGYIYWKEDKNAEAAKKEFGIALSIDPNLIDAYNDMGQLLESEGKVDQAIENYKKALAYVDDALAKERLKQRIDMLENPGKASAGSSSSLSSTSLSPASGQDVEKLQRELRKGSETSEAKTIDVGGVNRESDLQILNNDDAGFDLKAEAKKRTAKK
jgi:Tfp pilus assembly protein PilF